MPSNFTSLLVNFIRRPPRWRSASLDDLPIRLSPLGSVKAMQVICRDETPEQRAIRHEAATLSLIGLSIENTGIEDGDQVVFKLDAWLLGNALEAADRAGRLDGLNPPRE